MVRLLLGQLVNQQPIKGLLHLDSQTAESQTESDVMNPMYKQRQDIQSGREKKNEIRKIENEGNEQ